MNDALNLAETNKEIQEPAVPANDCPGCAARDRIIRSLAEKIDELDEAERSAGESYPVADAAAVKEAA